MTSLKEIFRAFGLRRCAVAVALAAAAVMGCSKEDTPAGGSGEPVLVRLPGVSLASPVEVMPGAPGAATRGGDPRSDSHGFGAFAEDGNAVADSPDGLFCVTLGARPTEGAGTDHAVAVAVSSGADSGVADAVGSAHSAVRAAASGNTVATAANDATGPAAAANHAPATAAASPATRADVALTNVWVFQFDASGNAVRCEKVDALGAGQALEVRLNSGEGYTIGVVAGGPASGLSTSNVPDLATFREGLLFTSPVASFDAAPCAGTLSGVSVLANGQIQVGGSAVNLPYIQLRRILAQVTVELTHDVADYALDGVELYSVPVGAAFAPDRAAAAFPAGEDANFGYRDNAAAGLAPHAQGSAGSTGHSYTWYVGQNRRGSGTGIAKVQDKNASKAPAYATYARVKTHSTTVEDAPLYYDIYLGEDMFSDFNVTANHVYSYTTRIIGSAESHYSLIDTDGRVSGKKPQHIEDATVTPSGAIPGEGKTYSLTLNGVLPAEGVEVRARVDGQTEPLVTGTATASGTAVELAVPANMSYNERTVSFEYKWNGTWTKAGSDSDRKQRGWTVDAHSHNAPATIPGSGGTYTVNLSGWLGGNYALQAVSGSTVLVGPTSTSTDDKQTTQSTDLKIPANTGAQRSVTFQYKFNGKWLDISPAVNQAAGGVTGATISPDPSGGFSADATTFTITLTGSLGSGISVQARLTDLTTVVATATATISGTGVTLKVPDNSYPNAARTIVFGYVEGGAFKEIKRGTQAAGENIDTGGGGTIIEPDPGKKVTWQQAIDYCKSKGDGWRLPTQNELMYYWSVEPSIPADSKFTAGLYWSAAEHSPGSGYAWAVHFNDGTTGTSSLSTSYSVRCVRDN